MLSVSCFQKQIKSNLQVLESRNLYNILESIIYLLLYLTQYSNPLLIHRVHHTQDSDLQYMQVYPCSIYAEPDSSVGKGNSKERGPTIDTAT